MKLANIFKRKQRSHYQTIGNEWFFNKSQINNIEFNLSAFWRAFTLISGTMASLPVDVYERLSDGGRQVVKDDLHRILTVSPNSLMTPFDFKQAISLNMEMYNEAFIVNLTSGGNLEAYPIPSNLIQDLKNGTYLVYFDETRQMTLPKEMVLHIPGLSFDGRNACPLPLYRKHSVLLAQAQELTSSEFLENGILPTTIITHGKNPKEEDKKVLREAMKKLYSGRGNRYKALHLWGTDAKVNEISFDPEKMQLLSSRKYAVTETARFIGVPPHKLYDMERATFSNIEEQNIEYVQDSILPRAIRIEERLAMYYILPANRDSQYVEFNLDGILRGNTAARWNAYQTARNIGALNADEIRVKENEPPIGGKAGTTYWQPVNMMDASTGGVIPTTSLERSERSVKRTSLYKQCRNSAANKRLITKAYVDQYRRSATAVVKKEVGHIRGLIDEGLSNDEMINAIQTFYSDDRFGLDVKREYTSVINSIADSIFQYSFNEVNADPVDLDRTKTSYLDNVAIKHIISSRSQLIDIINNADDVNAAVEERLSEWEERYPDKMARNEPIKSEGAFSLAAWNAVGVPGVMWIAFGESCAYCNSLSGNVIPIGQAFLHSGEEFEPDGAERPLSPSTDIRHQPAHNGCDCGSAAVMTMG